MSLSFHPLYWIYHDCWKWEETIPGYPENNISTFYHAGHIHYFFEKNNFSAGESASGQAYGGTQTYRFKIKDIWGPNSTDPNQAMTDKLIGKPMWYFHIEEYWRRIYVQPWSVADFRESHPAHQGESGIKYDSSKPDHSLGPFREGGGLYFFNSRINRTLPVEYWKDRAKTFRDLYTKKDCENSSGGFTWQCPIEVPMWSRSPKDTYYYNGDNSMNLRKDDIVSINVNGVKKYYKYTFEPHAYTLGNYSKNTRFWPNPTPGLTEEIDLLAEYIYYYGMVNEYSSYCTEKGIDSSLASSYYSFISFKITDMRKGKITYVIPGIQTVIIYGEYVTFDDFCSIFVPLTEKEIKELMGDYPVRKKYFDSENDESAFGEDPNPFIKDGIPVNPYEVYKEYFDRREIYAIPRGKIALGDGYNDGHPRELSFSEEDGARRNYPDDMFIGPVIEYQKVTHLNYERLPEGKTRDQNINVYTDKSGDFGDGFEMTIELPLKKNDEIQSPFSKNKVVYPAGIYQHGVVKEEDKLRYKVFRYEKLADVKKYMNHKYIEFVAKREQNVEGYNITDDEWFEANWENQPILRNTQEGTFYTSEYLDEPIWMPYLTQQFISEDQIDNEGYINSNGQLITGEGKIVSFNIPEGLVEKQDGVWVEQCLGGIVKAEVELVLEDALGHRRIERVSIVAANSADTFEGVDKATI